MKVWKWIILMALALISCRREEDMPVSEPVPVDVEGLPVTVHFSIMGTPSDVPTKSDSDGLDSDVNGGLETLHLAVFGGSGYLKEYVKAEMGATGTYTYNVEKVVQKKDGNGDPLYYTVVYNDITGEYEPTEEESTIPSSYPVKETIQIQRTVPVYHFTARIPMSTSRRTIHFLGNGPASLRFGWDSDVIPKQLSHLPKYNQEGGESLKAKAYWQMVEFDKGITAIKENGYYVSVHGYRYGVSDEEDAQFFEDGGFQIDPEVNDKFRMIPLIRNWAKVVLYSQPKEQSHFEAISMAVINVPSQGSLAPYSAATQGFVKNYQEKGFSDLRDMNYPASLPTNTVFDTSIPEASEFVPDPGIDPSVQFKDGGRVALASSLTDLYSEDDTESAVYLYERPAPSESIPPTYVIIYGKYFEHPDDPNDLGYPCYYKVDLMETVDVGNGDFESRYYPIYRNFKYQIWVTNILARGHDTPQAAAASAGSADVSADITTGHLADISDGVGRLHLSWMAKTYTGESDYVENTLNVFYSNPDGQPIMSVKDVPTDPNQPDVLPTKYVTVELLPPADKKMIGTEWDDVIDRETLSLGAPSEGGEGQSARGWRQVHFKVKAYDGLTARSQTIRISGVHNDGRVYRDVVISVLPKQPMKVYCGKERILARKGETQTVSFSIPDGLIKSMFPLEFKIEADRMTLTPDLSYNENMPVVSEESISLDPEFAGKRAFHFIKTITWDEYRDNEKMPLSMSDDDRLWRTVTCHFKTNCNDNHAKIWVANDFFILNDDSWDEFFNFDYKEFSDLVFPKPVPSWPDEDVLFRFSVQPKGKDAQNHNIYPLVTMTLRGMTVPDNELNEKNMQEVEAGVYTFTPTYSPISFTFRTLNNEGDVAVDLEAEDYFPEHKEPYHFNKGVPEYSYGLLEAIKVSGNWSNVAFGKVESGKKYDGSTKVRGVIFGYYDDPDRPQPTIYLRDMSDDHRPIGSASGSNSSGLQAVTPNNFTNGWTPTGPANVNGAQNYHEIVLQTDTKSSPSYDPIRFLLEADGYVTSVFEYERLVKPRLHTYDIADLVKNGKSSWAYLTKVGDIWRFVPAIPQNKTLPDIDFCAFVIDIEPLDGAPDPIVNTTGNSKGIYLGGATGTGPCTGGSYRFTFRSGNVSQYGLTYDVSSTSNGKVAYKAQCFYNCQFAIPTTNKPASVVPEVGTYFPYPGANNLYQWIAFDHKEDCPTSWATPTEYVKSIVITAGTDHPVYISSMVYKALSEVP